MIEVLKFSTKICLPCRMMTKVIHDAGLAEQITELDVDSNKDIARQFGIRSVPTLVLVQDGTEVKRSVGSLTALQLKEFLGEPNA